MKQLLFGALAAMVATGCDCTGSHLSRTAGDAGSATDAGAAPADAGTTDAGSQCAPTTSDQAGCTCFTQGAVRGCYSNTANPNTEGVGACHGGTQTCSAEGEFLVWGPCQNAVTPSTEVCNDGLDNDCNGKTDCGDPACAQSPDCQAACTDGQTRPCYDGPSGTDGIGLCHDGTQTCTGGQWPAGCPGEVTPQAETCTDALDHNCNGLPGCLDFSCAISPACQDQCDAGIRPGCVCPTGSGDSATCPDGMFGVSQSGSGFGSPAIVACCPCTANDCGNAGCCAETVCQGSSQCSGLTCKPLPPSCNGQVNMDCDDFPEDCDEPCCKCTSCNCAASGASCSQDSDCCSQTCNGGTCG